MKNKQEQTFVQVWDYILDNEELDVTDVLLLSKVISLHSTEDGCYMTNDYICKMLRLKNIETASRRINKLERLGYVALKYIPLPTNSKKTRRYIVPTYQNGLTQKSSRVDLKVNNPLTTKSSTLDLKVNTPLILKSREGCLESQSITSVDNINENINSLNQLNNISSIILTEFDKKELLSSLENSIAPDKVLNEIKTLIKDGPDFLTRRNKDLIIENKNYFKGKLLQKLIQQLV